MPIRQRGRVHQVHQHRCNHGLQCHPYPPSRSCRYVTCRPTLHFSPGLVGSTSPRLTRHVHLWCYTRHMSAAKIPNYSTTSERSSRKDSPTGIDGLVLGRAKNRKSRKRADSWSVEWSVTERLVRTYIVMQAHYGTATTTNDGGPR